MYPQTSESSALAARLLNVEPWEFSRKELARGFWGSRATSLDGLRTVLLFSIFESSRDPLSLYEQEEFLRDRALVQKSLAFGQHLYPLRQDRRQYGQLGLYGCAAVVETLSYSAEMQGYLSNGKGNGFSPQLQGQILDIIYRTWRYTDLAYLRFAEHNKSKFWEQSRTTLRALHVLRAAAAALPIFQKAANDEELEHDPELWPDVEPVESCKRVGTKVVEHLERVKVPRAAGFDLNFKFALGAEEVPSSPDDWLFMVSEVIISLMRAYSANVVTEEQLVARGDGFLSSEGVRQIIEVAEGRFLAANPRFRLFACYALAHMSPKFVGGFPLKVMPPGRLHMLEAQEVRLEEAVRSLAPLLFSSPANLFDIHSPYHIFLQDDTRPRYRDDYFVVPVVPVLLSVLGVVAPDYLFSKEVVGLLGRLVARAGGSFAQVSLRALPYQVEPYNGTMNVCYYAECLRVIEREYRSVGWLRLYFALLKRLRRRSREGIVIAVLLVLLWLFLGDPETPATAKAFVGGTLASVLAALLAPRLVRWWYGAAAVGIVAGDRRLEE